MAFYNPNTKKWRFSSSSKVTKRQPGTVIGPGAGAVTSTMQGTGGSSGTPTFVRQDAPTERERLTLPETVTTPTGGGTPTVPVKPPASLTEDARLPPRAGTEVRVKQANAESGAPVTKGTDARSRDEAARLRGTRTTGGLSYAVGREGPRGAMRPEGFLPDGPIQEAPLRDVPAVPTPTADTREQIAAGPQGGIRQGAATMTLPDGTVVSLAPQTSAEEQAPEGFAPMAATDTLASRGLTTPPAEPPPEQPEDDRFGYRRQEVSEGEAAGEQEPFSEEQEQALLAEWQSAEQEYKDYYSNYLRTRGVPPPPNDAGFQAARDKLLKAQNDYKAYAGRRYEDPGERVNAAGDVLRNAEGQEVFGTNIGGIPAYEIEIDGRDYDIFRDPLPQEYLDSMGITQDELQKAATKAWMQQNGIEGSDPNMFAIVEALLKGQAGSNVYIDDDYGAVDGEGNPLDYGDFTTLAEELANPGSYPDMPPALKELIGNARERGAENEALGTVTGGGFKGTPEAAVGSNAVDQRMAEIDEALAGLDDIQGIDVEENVAAARQQFEVDRARSLRAAANRMARSGSSPEAMTAMQSQMMVEMDAAHRVQEAQQRLQGHMYNTSLKMDKVRTELQQLNALLATDLTREQQERAIAQQRALMRYEQAYNKEMIRMQQEAQKMSFGDVIGQIALGGITGLVGAVTGGAGLALGGAVAGAIGGRGAQRAFMGQPATNHRDMTSGMSENRYNTITSPDYRIWQPEGSK